MKAGVSRAREADPAIDRLLDQFHAQTPIRAGSLIVTLFGDAILPRGGTLSLASITTIMRAFRIGEGLVRTAMSRLVHEGLFDRISVGRNSFFRLSKDGETLFSDAARRIYGAPPQDWNGVLTLALLDSSDRQILRAQLASEDFAQLTPDLMIAVATTADAPGGALFLQVQPKAEDAKRLAFKAWPLNQLGGRYASFQDKFRPLLDRSGGQLQALDALIARILLIQDYRRIVLRDPLLPLPLLPDAWPGCEARRLCATLYHNFLPRSEEWLSAHATTVEGPLPPPAESQARRFSAILPTRSVT
jgi:phenylacetic acid degradation operon negative regulatory protein